MKLTEFILNKFIFDSTSMRSKTKYFILLTFKNLFESSGLEDKNINFND